MSLSTPLRCLARGRGRGRVRVRVRVRVERVAWRCLEAEGCQMGEVVTAGPWR